MLAQRIFNRICQISQPSIKPKKLCSSFFFPRSSWFHDDVEDDDETTLQDTNVTTNELTMDTAQEESRVGQLKEAGLVVQQYYGWINHSLWQRILRYFIFFNLFSQFIRTHPLPEISETISRKLPIDHICRKGVRGGERENDSFCALF